MNSYQVSSKSESIVINLYKVKAEIKEKTFSEFIKPAPEEGHMLIQPVLTVDGDKSTGHWIRYHFNNIFKGPSGQTLKRFGPNLQSRYDCEYKKEDGKWNKSNNF